jgi:serine/threonine-protein kinase
LSTEIALGATLEDWVDTEDSQVSPMRTRFARGTYDSQRALDALFARVQAANETEPRLRIRGLIGEGGMARVHLGDQLGLHREVAVKSLHSYPDRAAKEALLHEAWLTGALEHPNIVPVHELEWDRDGQPVVVMRRIDGITWSKLIDDPDQVRERFAVSDVLEWHLRVLMQVCNAIHYAHSRGVVHRDIKPDNVMVGAFGEVYVMDWGIAVPIRGPLRDVLAALPAPRCAGTPAYVAPEMISGDPLQVDERSDVYLLGASLFHCAIGHPPHTGNTVLEALLAAHRGSFAIPESIESGLRDVIERALARDPAERFQTAEELRKALHDVLEHRSSSQLTDSASAEHDELRALLGADAPGERETWKRVYKLFAACRYGYRAALDLWPQNQRALDGLAHATEDMIRAELAGGDPRAARKLLDELEQDVPELRDEVDAALVAAEEREAVMRGAAERQDQLSPFWGTRERTALAIFLALFFGMRTLFFPPTENIEHLVANLGLSLFVGGFALHKREGLLTSCFNMRVFFLLLTALLINSVVRSVGILQDMSAEASGMMEAAAHFSLVMAAVAAVDRRLAALALVYAVNLYVALSFPNLQVLVAGISHTFLGVFIALLWSREPTPLGTSSSALGGAKVSSL